MLTRPVAPRRVTAERFAGSVLLGAAAAALIWAVTGGNAGPWPLLLAVPPFFVAGVWGHRSVRRTPLDLPLLLFAITALVAVWVAYNRELAGDKFWLLVGALLLFYALSLQRERNLWRAAGSLALLGVLVAVYFLFTHDWTEYPVKFALVDRVATWWMGLRPAPRTPALLPNVAGSLMAMLIPFQLVWALDGYKRKHRAQLILAGCALGLTILGLVLTSSRGALLAGFSATGISLLWFAASAKKPTTTKKLRPVVWAGLLLLPLLFTMIFATYGTGDAFTLLDQLPGRNRAVLEAETRRLAADFTFTGGGLASFPGLYSQYVLRIPFYYLPNGHNVFLDIALEQGVFGITSFLVITAITFWLLLYKGNGHKGGMESFWPRSTLLRVATMASFTTLLWHGLVEDTVYGSNALPLLLVAPGYTVALISSAAQRATSRRPLPLTWRVNIAGAVALIAFTILMMPGTRAAIHANVGAVRMAQVQLAGWPTGAWGDTSDAMLMTSAETHFKQAVSLDPLQRTARYRLGTLAMQRRDYGMAISHLIFAHYMDPDHDGIRKALGYSYLWAGNEERGVELLSTVEGTRQELRVYSGWWRRHGRADLALVAARAVEQFGQAKP